MSFKLTIEIKDDASTQVDFDGTVNHVVLLGVLESVKHGILGTADMMAAQEVLSSIQDGNDEEGAAPAPSALQGD
jgi:hypothetical protein